jgi:hypothetical protein
LQEKYRNRAVYLLEYNGFDKPFIWRRVRGPESRLR